jgi:2-desacetyl-2-hydroxyethyl bacteriochlorophyllide A dehydrogenase
MKQAVMTAPGEIELRDVPIPEYGDGEVLVKIEAVGLCTWEQKYFAGVPGSYPFVGGHEICGTVAAVGKDVAQRLEPGDRVVVASLTRCGECYYCRRGLDNLCLNTGSESSPGAMWGPGGFAGYFAARGYEVYKIAGTTDPAVGTLAEPLACVIRSIERGAVEFGDVAVVLGGGVMGIIHILLAKARGARVIMSEPDAGRRAKALELGAVRAVDPLNESLKDAVLEETGGIGARAVFFTAGGAKAIAGALGVLAKDGILVVYGATPKKDILELDPSVLHYDEIFLTGVTKHTKESFRQAAEIISLGELPLDKLISGRKSFTDIKEAFGLASSLETYRIVVEMQTER